MCDLCVLFSFENRTFSNSQKEPHTPVCGSLCANLCEFCEFFFSKEINSFNRPPIGAPYPDAHLALERPQEHDGVSSHELLLVDEAAPACRQQMPTRGSSVDVPKLPDSAVDVLREHRLRGWVRRVVQQREDGLRAVSWHREASPIVGIRLCQRFRKRRRLLRRIRASAVTTAVSIVYLCREELHQGENLVSLGISLVVDCADLAEDERRAAPQVDGRLRLLCVALQEVVNQGV